MQLLKLSLVGILVVVLAAGGTAAFFVWDSFQRFTDNSVELPSDGIALIPPALSFEPYEGEVTFLLTGTDECEPEFSHIFGKRCDSSEEGARNDVTLLVHVPEDHSQATVVSFPRDLMTDFPSCTNENGVTISGGSYRQINTAYDSAGLGCVAAVVEELSGLQIPFAAKISWGGVITITDQLGGVDVCVANGIHDRHTGLALEPGVHTLQGVEALQFLRTRHGLSDGSDLARISNQQLYMSALLKKLTSDGTLEDFFSMARIAETVVNNVEHSSSLNEPTTLVSLALLLKELPLDQITFVQFPTVYDPSNPNRVIPKSSELDAFWETVKGNGVIEIQKNGSGALVEEPLSEGETAEQPPAEDVPVASAPGLRADMNACANGAG